MHICWSHALQKKSHSMTFLHLSHIRQSSAAQSTRSIFTHLPYFLVFITSIVFPYKSFSHFSASSLTWNSLCALCCLCHPLFATSCCYIRLKIIIILFTKGLRNCLFCFYLQPLFSFSKHFVTLLHQCSKRELQVIHCCIWKGFSRVTFPFSMGTLPNLAAHFLQLF